MMMMVDDEFNTFLGSSGCGFFAQLGRKKQRKQGEELGLELEFR